MLVTRRRWGYELRRRIAEIAPEITAQTVFSEDILDETASGCRAGTLPCVQCKQNLADRVIAYFEPFRERRAELEEPPGRAEKTLGLGREKVRPVVEETMAAVREGMHL